MTVKELLIMFYFTLPTTSSLKLPTYINPCSRNDADLDACVLRAGQAAIPKFIHGDPKYRIPDLDPLAIEELTVRQGTPQVGLFLRLVDCQLYGMSNAQFTAARMDLKNKHIEWDFINKKGVQIIGNYNISGQVLILPITGSGKANITIRNLAARYKFDYELVTRGSKGKQYLNVTRSELASDIGGAAFQLENLFNGDRLLGDNMNRFMNENWKDLIVEFGPAVEAALGEVFLRLLTSIHGLVPFDLVYPQ